MGARQSAEMKEALRLLQEQPALSRAEVARRVGIDRSTLTKHFNKMAQSRPDAKEAEK